MRRDAIARFMELDFPTSKDEEWKYTNVSPILGHSFHPSDDIPVIGKNIIDKFLFDNLEHSLLVFVNGFYSQELSRIKDLPAGVIAGNIAKEITNPLIKKHFGSYADYKENIFTSLSTAFIKDGAFVFIPDGIILQEAIHILFISSSGDNKLLFQPRNLFVAGKNSQATIIEHYTSNSEVQPEEIYFTNSVTEIFVGENSYLEHIKLQDESKKAFHISRMEVIQERNSNFNSHSISLGAEISRNEHNSRFNNVGGECTLNGLFITDGNQLSDTHTLIDHAKPYCNSHEHYKGILDGKSRGVFNGKVIVRKDAQKTNAFQENNNIILSNDSLVNTKPQLEIFADDVKCSHGATIGQLDADAMFYLKSRGIGFEAGRTILIHAFASDVIKSIKVDAVRNYIENILAVKFNS
jgi:Fe-S cluster assembly protein SufD